MIYTDVLSSTVQKRRAREVLASLHPDDSRARRASKLSHAGYYRREALWHLKDEARRGIVLIPASNPIAIDQASMRAALEAA